MWQDLKSPEFYPFNPNAIVIQDGSHESASVAESTLIAYIPLYSPPKRNRSKEIRSPESSCSLTASPTSPQSHPSAACTPASSPSPSHLVCGLHEDAVYALPKKSTLSKFLTYPHPPSKRDPPKRILSAKVLTSAENIKMQEKAEAKEKRKQECERRVLEKERQKLKLAIEKEKAKQEKEVQARKKEELGKNSH